MPYSEKENFSLVRNTLSSNLKGAVKSVLGSSLSLPLRWWYGGMGSVLVYHRITAFKDFSLRWRDPDYFSPNLGLSVHADRFREQMKFIRERYTPIPISQIFDPPAAERGKPYVMVTFDDGYLDNLELALPIAEEFEIPITVFVTTGFIDRVASPWWIALESHLDKTTRCGCAGNHYSYETVAERMKTFDELEYLFRRSSYDEQKIYCEEIGCHMSEQELNELFMNWEQLAAFSKHPLVTIGAHTVHHIVQSQEARKIADQEMRLSRERLQKELEVPIDFFAHTFGDRQACGRRESELARDVGFTASVTTRSGHLFKEHQSSPQMIPRITIDYYDDLKSFSYKLSGVESICTDPLSRIVTY